MSPSVMDAPFAAATPTPSLSPAVRTLRYASQAHLWGLWRRHDRKEAAAVVLRFGPSLTADLAEIVPRRTAAARLVLVPTPGHWPGCSSLGDLALSAPRYGWRAIEMAWSLEEAVERHREASREALDDLGATGGILVFAPAIPSGGE